MVANQQPSEEFIDQNFLNVRKMLNFIFTKLKKISYTFSSKLSNYFFNLINFKRH